MSLTDLDGHVRHFYEESGRHYHNWQHIEALLRWLECGEFAVHDIDSVRCAILYHDAIYDPHAADNEERSAVLAEHDLAGLVPSDRLRRTAAMIRATAGHQIPASLDGPERADMAHFLDMDLSILGSEPAVFATYESNIRAEYAHVADGAFKAGRAAILSRFLERERLYFSDWGHKRFEAAARRNLMTSIEMLTGAA